PLTASALRRSGVSTETLKRLAAKEWIRAAPAGSGAKPLGEPPSEPTRVELPTLTQEQSSALAEIGKAPPGYAAFLLHGITGSGKTEIFLRLIAEQLAQSRQT